MEGVKTEGQVWKLVNSERRRGRRVEKGIKILYGLFGGAEWRVRKGGEKRRGRTRRES